MAFPASPTLNQIYTSGGVDYKCTAVGPPAIWERAAITGGGTAASQGTVDAGIDTTQFVTAATLTGRLKIPANVPSTAIVAPVIKVTNVALSAPSAVNGTYFVKATATGAWAGQDNKLATTTDGGASWTYATLSEGQEVYDLAGHALYIVNALGTLSGGGGGGSYLEQATAPISPSVNLIWKNTANAIVSGVAAGADARWTGSVWRQLNFGSVQTTHTDVALSNGNWVTLPLSTATPFSAVDEKWTISGNTLACPVTGDYEYSLAGFLSIVSTTTPAAPGRVTSGIGLSINGVDPTIFAQSVDNIPAGDPFSCNNILHHAKRSIALTAGNAISLRAYALTTLAASTFSALGSQSWINIERKK
jgi:Protein of unknown function (DUF2793)